MALESGSGVDSSFDLEISGELAKRSGEFGGDFLGILEFFGVFGVFGALWPESGVQPEEFDSSFWRFWGFWIFSREFS